MADKIIKRLEKETQDNKTPGETFYTQPIDTNKYKWHFTLIGVPGSIYEGGLYHGLLDLPENYPLSAPNIYFHNENGRYSPNVKICLNITSYHQESWSPIWGVRKIMEALTAYFVCDEGGIGSIVETKEKRKKLAISSRKFACPHCGPLKDIESIILKANPKIEAQIKAEKPKEEEKLPQKEKTTKEKKQKKIKK